MTPLPSTPASHPDSPSPVLVWDLPVRVFHWLLALCFAGAWLTAETERWRLLHATLGYTFGGLVAFRLLWGLVGSRHARFGSFVRGPRAVLRYLGALLRGRPEHHVGHNPAGALAIVLMLGLGLAIAGSGWALYNDLGPEALEDLHEAAAQAMLAVVGVHIAGVLIASRLHHENLVGAMLSGRKAAPPAEGIRSAWRSVAVLMLAAVIGFWAWQWQSAPAGGLAATGTEIGNEVSSEAGTTAAVVARRRHRPGDDDD